ncbi:MAG: family 16 glycosylhydrolase [Spirochaetales bacterium]|nr:family 16 glycosylhydrolase [Spirochaetales bacterium]
MSAKIKIFLINVSVLLALFIFSCQVPAGSGDNPTGTRAITDVLQDPFDSYDTTVWHKADGWSNGRPFNCTWRATQVTFADGLMRLALEKDTVKRPPYKSGEYRTNDFCNYGLYEVRMKPARNIGIVSSFFTYTGPSDGNPWDEIDIEFLGKDTTRMQINYWTDGVGGHEVMIDLSFDAADNYHTYAFEWLADSITWYVDGTAVHTATSNIPGTPSRIMMNLWPGIGVDSWLGRFDGTVPLYAYYDWVKFTPDDGPSPTPAPTPTTTPDPNDLKIYVDNIFLTTGSSGPLTQVNADVLIKDQNGTPVEGASVDISWSGIITTGTINETTLTSGIATFYSSKTKKSGDVTVTVNNVTKTGWTYDPNLNNMTSHTITVP